jgi:hypothetical protein
VVVLWPLSLLMPTRQVSAVASAPWQCAAWGPHSWYTARQADLLQLLLTQSDSHFVPLCSGIAQLVGTHYAKGMDPFCTSVGALRSFTVSMGCNWSGPTALQQLANPWAGGVHSAGVLLAWHPACVHVWVVFVQSS